MATFKPVVRTKKEFNTVYIRITHGSSKVDYIKMNMVVHKSGIRKGEITDHIILSNCALKIKSYIEKINSVNIEGWTIQELKKFLTSENKKISFSDFAEKYISKMIVDGRKHPAANYSTALNSFKSHFGNEIYFSDITSKELKKWIESLIPTKRAKEHYPTMIKKIFEEGCIEYNDYDRNIIRIANQPFRNIKIPNADVPEKRSVEAEIIRKIFSVKPEYPREELAHDVAAMIIHLAGINTADLYDLQKFELKGKKLCYTRKKTEKERKDKAYIEITVPEKIIHLIDKYKGNKRLFSFCELYSDESIFSTAVNKGLKRLCEKANVQKITSYYLRHTWATIAKNKCGVSTEFVAFCLNHVSAHKTTEEYIKKDFTPIDELNEKVINYLFESTIA
jgi:integrase